MLAAGSSSSTVSASCDATAPGWVIAMEIINRRRRPTAVEQIVGLCPNGPAHGAADGVGRPRPRRRIVRHRRLPLLGATSTSTGCHFPGHFAALGTTRRFGIPDRESVVREAAVQRIGTSTSSTSPSPRCGAAADRHWPPDGAQRLGRPRWRGQVVRRRRRRPRRGPSSPAWQERLAFRRRQRRAAEVATARLAAARADGRCTSSPAPHGERAGPGSARLSRLAPRRRRPARRRQPALRAPRRPEVAAVAHRRLRARPADLVGRIEAGLRAPSAGHDGRPRPRRRRGTGPRRPVTCPAPTPPGRGSPSTCTGPAG